MNVRDPEWEWKYWRDRAIAAEAISAEPREAAEHSLAGGLVAYVNRLRESYAATATESGSMLEDESFIPVLFKQIVREWEQQKSRITDLERQLQEKDERIEELNRIKAQTWTEYEMADAQWTFTFHIHRDDGEDVLAHELAHAVQRFRWPDDEVHSDRHADLTADIAVALKPEGSDEVRRHAGSHWNVRPLQKSRVTQRPEGGLTVETTVTSITQIPLGVFDGATRYVTDDEYVLSVWRDGNTWDIRIPKIDMSQREYVPLALGGGSFQSCPDCGALVYDTAQHDEFHKWVYPRDKADSVVD